MRGVGIPGARPPVAAYGETYYPRYHYGWSELKSIRDDRYKFVLAPKPELYDLQTDRGETRNLVSEQPQLARRREVAGVTGEAVEERKERLRRHVLAERDEVPLVGALLAQVGRQQEGGVLPTLVALPEGGVEQNRAAALRERGNADCRGAVQTRS